MATVTAFIRTSKKSSSKVKVRFRLRDGRDIQLFHSSEIEVNPTHWDAKKQELKAKIVYDYQKRALFNTAVSDRKNIILSIYMSKPNNISVTSDWLDGEIERALNPDKYEMSSKTLIDFFDEFLMKRKISTVLLPHFKVVKRMLQRYELHKNIKLDIDNVTADTLRDLEKFLADEYKYFNESGCKPEYAHIYTVFGDSRSVLPRGKNTLSAIFKKIRTFYLWCISVGFTTNNPFNQFSIEDGVYGTPYYITIDERNQIYAYDFSRNPQIAIQRDIFVFQCLIGCRVGDLYRLTKQNIIEGFVEYIPRKTKDGRPVTVTVPLNSIAQEILKRYSDYEGEKLFPFISEQKYNIAIKKIFKTVGVTRLVTIIDSVTRESKQVPICDVASSHIARRCFVGNLYKKVKDPNLVGALSGHTEGSKAFVRYREIDKDIKIELVKMLE